RRYILGGTNLSTREFFGELARVAGLRPRGLLPLPGWLLPAVAVVAQWRARRTGKEPFPSCQAARLNRLYWFARPPRARDDLGYAPRPLDVPLSDPRDWFAQQGLLPLRGLPRWWMRPGDLREGDSTSRAIRMMPPVEPSRSRHNRCSFGETPSSW